MQCSLIFPFSAEHLSIPSHRMFVAAAQTLEIKKIKIKYRYLENFIHFQITIN
jgi:hypothetical protein